MPDSIPAISPFSFNSQFAADSPKRHSKDGLHCALEVLKCLILNSFWNHIASLVSVRRDVVLHSD